MKLTGSIAAIIIIFTSVRFIISGGFNLLSAGLWLLGLFSLGLVYYLDSKKDYGSLRKNRFGSFIRGLSFALLITWFMGMSQLGFDTGGISSFFIYSLIAGIIGLMFSLAFAFS